VNKLGWKVVPLARSQDWSAFDCGVPALNDWLRAYALHSEKSGGARVFTAVDPDNCVVAYYAITAQSVVAHDAPERLRKGMPRHPIPVLLLARLAVDERFKGQGLGAGLLKNALLRCSNAAREVGVRAVIVDAKNEVARRFYQRFNFEVFPEDPNRLFLLMKDLNRIVERSK
jgi:GNAT superfamily N-acetyltransferase